MGIVVNHTCLDEFKAREISLKLFLLKEMPWIQWPTYFHILGRLTSLCFMYVFRNLIIVANRDLDLCSILFPLITSNMIL